MEEDIFALTQSLKELLQKTREEMNVFIKYRETIDKTISALNERIEKLEKEIQKDSEIKELVKNLIKKMLE